MKKTTLTLLAVAVMAGAGQADAQQRDDDGSWWQPAVLSLVDRVADRTVRGTEDDWWWKSQPRRGDDDRYDRYENRNDDRYDRYEDRDDDRYEERGRSGKRGNGPPFCRNGAGHPVHGMEWCRRKGWGRGYGTSWDRVGWEDVIFGRRAPTRDRYVRQPTLSDILGEVVFGRLARHGRSQGLSGSMDARWVPTRAGSVLQLRMGGAPLAELTDANRDGRVDVVLLGRRN